MKLKKKVKKYGSGGNNTLSVDNTRVDKIYVDKSKTKNTYKSPYSKEKQEWINKSSGRIEESISPLDLIPIGAVNTSSKFINNAFKFYSNYNKAADVVNGYELYNDLDRLPEKKENMNIYRDGGFDSLPQVFADGGISRFETPISQAQSLSAFQLPYNEIASALLSKQKALDQDKENALSYLDYNNKLQSLPQDSPIKAEIANNLNNLVEETQGIDLRSPEGQAKMRGLKGYVRKEFGPTGRATAMMGNYSAYNEWLKRQQENYKSKNITQEQLQRANDVYLNKYQGIGQIDPNTSNYNQFKAPDVAKYVDPTEFVDKYGKDFEANIRQSAYAKTGNDGYLHEGTDYTEVLTPQEIAEAIKNYAYGNPEMSNYLRQGAEIGLFDEAELEKGPFEYKQVKTKDGKTITQLDFNERNPLGYALAGASSKYSKDIYKATRNIKDDSGYWKKKEIEDVNKEDLIDAGTWKSGAFSYDVENAGEGFFNKIFKGGTPKYEQFNKEYSTKKEVLNQLLAKRKEGVKDFGLEDKIRNTENEISQMDNVNKKLDELYNEAYEKTSNNKFELKPYVNPQWDEATKAEVLKLQKNQITAKTNIDKGKFFEENLKNISRAVTQFQRGVKIDNPSIDFEVATGLTSQKGKKVFGNNGEQLDADFAIPTGYVTKLAGTDEGIYNLSNAYFSDKDEAKKAGIELVEMKGKEANEDLVKTQQAASSKGTTIPLSLYPDDATVYKVKTYSEATSATKSKYENLLYNKNEQEVSNKLNSNIKSGLGGIVKINDNVTIGYDSNSDNSPYIVILSDGNETKTYRFKDETQAVKVANKVKSKFK